MCMNFHLENERLLLHIINRNNCVLVHVFLMPLRCQLTIPARGEHNYSARFFCNAILKKNRNKNNLGEKLSLDKNNE